MTRDKQLAAGALALVLFGALAIKQMSDDAKIGPLAFMEKRTPDFTGK